jgi:histidinol phosphatase-like PHP family hydrolase
MYNLHCHSLLSDGVLLPSEVAVRYQAAGWRAIAITDHADYSNIEAVAKSILEFARNWPREAKIKVLPGIELTHLPPEQFAPLAEFARVKGIRIIVGHGETTVEPVLKGTNRACLQADIDILAHPGLISEEDVLLAKEKGIFLELTTRQGHRDTNQHVAGMALKYGAKLIINTDSHAPQDIISCQDAAHVALEAGLSREQIDKIYERVGQFLKEKEEK